jgi:hypothetical protein
MVVAMRVPRSVRVDMLVARMSRIMVVIVRAAMPMFSLMDVIMKGPRHSNPCSGLEI